LQKFEGCHPQQINYLQLLAFWHSKTKLQLLLE